MKIGLLIPLIIISTSVLFAQTQVSKHYHYLFSFKGENIELNLLDSLIVTKNKALNVATEKRFSKKENKTLTQQIYRNKNGEDSIRKWFEKDKLIKTEKYNYDQSGILSSSTLKDIVNPKNSVEKKYIFTDSITEEGRINTMMVFRTYAKMLNSLDYTLKTYYDKENKPIKQTRKDISGEKELFNTNKPLVRRSKNNIVYSEIAPITKKELNNKTALIKKYLLPLKQKFKDPKYISLHYTFASSDSSIVLIIKRNKRENVQRAEITVTEMP